MSLGDKTKNGLKYSSCKFGFCDKNFLTTHSTSFKPIEKMQKSMIDLDNKRTNIEFNPVKNDIEKKTIYKSDFINRD